MSGGIARELAPVGDPESDADLVYRTLWHQDDEQAMFGLRFTKLLGLNAQGRGKSRYGKDDLAEELAISLSQLVSRLSSS
ncbi:hypothetical protein R1flu_003522 [Riccia fluitans]|uniref:Uncharacterized protein n=1 Tax=Riccia fluitans TaxID=41844 RepID=A0ABD1YCB1_9MARC